MSAGREKDRGDRSKKDRGKEREKLDNNKDFRDRDRDRERDRERASSKEKDSKERDRERSKEREDKEREDNDLSGSGRQRTKGDRPRHERSDSIDRGKVGDRAAKTDDNIKGKPGDRNSKGAEDMKVKISDDKAKGSGQANDKREDRTKAGDERLMKGSKIVVDSDPRSKVVPDEREKQSKGNHSDEKAGSRRSAGLPESKLGRASNESDERPVKANGGEKGTAEKGLNERPQHNARQADEQAKQGDVPEDDKDNDRSRTSLEERLKLDEKFKDNDEKVKSGVNTTHDPKAARRSIGLSTPDSSSKEPTKDAKEKPQQSRYNTVGKTWKEKEKEKEKEKDNFTNINARSTKGGDLITPGLNILPKTKFDPEKRRSLATDITSGPKRDTTKPETQVERLVKDLKEKNEKKETPSLPAAKKSSALNSTGNTTSTVTSSNEGSAPEEESRRLVWRKNVSSAGVGQMAASSGPVAIKTEQEKEKKDSAVQPKRSAGSMIVRPASGDVPANPEFAGLFLKELRNATRDFPREASKEPPKEQIATVKETSTREPPIPGVGGPAMPGKVSALAGKYDMLAPMRESLAQKAKAESDLAHTQKLQNEVKDLRVKVRQLEKALRLEKDETLRYKALYDELRRDVEEALHRTVMRSRNENGAGEGLVAKPRSIFEAVDRRGPSTPKPNPRSDFISPMESSVDEYSLRTNPSGRPPSPTSAASTQATGTSQTGLSSNQVTLPYGNTSATKGTMSSPTHAPKPHDSRDDSGNHVHCFIATRRVAREKDKEVVAVIHADGIRVVKPVSEEILEELKWEQIHGWVLREEDQQFKFSVESKATAEFVSHSYETENINEVAQVVNKFTEVAKAADDGEGGSILKKRSLTDGASKESTVTIALPTSTDDNETSSVSRTKKSSFLKKFSSFQKRKKSVIVPTATNDA